MSKKLVVEKTKLIIEIDTADCKVLNDLGGNGLEFNDTLEGRCYRAISKGKQVKTGNWQIIWHKDLLGRWSNWYEYKCSVCKKSIAHYDKSTDYATKFCPHCGSLMSGAVEVKK